MKEGQGGGRTAVKRDEEGGEHHAAEGEGAGEGDRISEANGGGVGHGRGGGGGGGGGGISWLSSLSGVGSMTDESAIRERIEEVKARIR
jgi:hypothetical protein